MHRVPGQGDSKDSGPRLCLLFAQPEGLSARITDGPGDWLVSFLLKNPGSFSVDQISMLANMAQTCPQKICLNTKSPLPLCDSGHLHCGQSAQRTGGSICPGGRGLLLWWQMSGFRVLAPEVPPSQRLTGAYLASSSGRHRVWVGGSCRVQERGPQASSGCSAERDQACQEPTRRLGPLEVGEGGMDRNWDQGHLLPGRPVLCTLPCCQS